MPKGQQAQAYGEYPPWRISPWAHYRMCTLTPLCSDVLHDLSCENPLHIASYFFPVEKWKQFTFLKIKKMIPRSCRCPPFRRWLQWSGIQVPPLQLHCQYWDEGQNCAWLSKKKKKRGGCLLIISWVPKVLCGLTLTPYFYTVEKKLIKTLTFSGSWIHFIRRRPKY